MQRWFTRGASRGWRWSMCKYESSFREKREGK